MRLVWGHDAWFAKWVGERVGIEDFGLCIALGIVDQYGNAVGGVVYNNYRYNCHLEATIATISPKWCSKDVLSGIFAYPFHQLGCPRLTATTEVMNQPARAFLCRLGFRQEGILRKWFPGGIDAVVYGMLAEECRWIKPAEGRMDRAA